MTFNSNWGAYFPGPHAPTFPGNMQFAPPPTIESSPDVVPNPPMMVQQLYIRHPIPLHQPQMVPPVPWIPCEQRVWYLHPPMFGPMQQPQNSGSPTRLLRTQHPAQLPVVENFQQNLAPQYVVCEAGANVVVTNSQQISAPLNGMQHGEVVSQPHFEAGARIVPQGKDENLEQVSVASNAPLAQTFQPYSEAGASVRQGKEQVSAANDAPFVQTSEDDETAETEEVAPESEAQVVASSETIYTFEKQVFQTDADVEKVKETIEEALQKSNSKILRDGLNMALLTDQHHKDDLNNDGEQNWENTNSLFNVHSIISDMQKKGQELTLSKERTLGCPLLVSKLTIALENMMKMSFDESVVDFSGMVESQNLLRAMQSFKIKNIYIKSLDSLRSHMRHRFSEFADFVNSLRTYFLQVKTKLTPDQLQCFVEFMHEVSKLFKDEMKNKQRITPLTKLCVKFFNFLKSGKYDPRDSLVCEVFGDKVRALEFSVLSFVMMKIPGCNLGQNVPHERAERGPHVLRVRLHQRCWCRREGFKFVELLSQIKTTNAIDIKNIYVRHEYKKSQKKESKPKKNAHSNKSSKKNAHSNKSSKKDADNQERNFSGVTVDVITSSPLQVDRLKQLLIAFGEIKENRDLVFKRYPKLYAKQIDALTFDEDKKRSEERQKIIRKGGSNPYTEAFWSQFGPEFGPYANTICYIDADVRSAFCEINFDENYRFSEEAKTRQGQMYKFDVALPKGTRKAPPVKDYRQFLLRTAQSEIAVQTRI